MAKPKVCFLGTVLNGELYLAETIRSLLEQSLKEIEVIYIDDGSTDSTTKVLDYFAKDDERFSYFSLKSNQGIAKAWNFGLQKVNAPVICICSADDIYDPKRAELSYKALTVNNKGDVFYGAFLRTDSQLRLLQGELPNGEKRGKKEAIPWKKGKLFLPNNQYIGHGFTSIKTSWAKKVQYREELKVGIDYPFFKDLETAGAKFCWTKRVLGAYRFHGKMVSQTRRKEVEDANTI